VKTVLTVHIHSAYVAESIRPKALIRPIYSGIIIYRPLIGLKFTECIDIAQHNNGDRVCYNN
jgi:hypothetical protein